jgi:hypothetical protein
MLKAMTEKVVFRDRNKFIVREEKILNLGHSALALVSWQLHSIVKEKTAFRKHAPMNLRDREWMLSG